MKNNTVGIDRKPENPQLLFGPGTIAAELQQAEAEEIAEFIGAALVELRKMAVNFKMKFLVYLLEMAYCEASKLVNTGDGLEECGRQRPNGHSDSG